MTEFRLGSTGCQYINDPSVSLYKSLIEQEYNTFPVKSTYNTLTYRISNPNVLKKFPLLKKQANETYIFDCKSYIEKKNSKWHYLGYFFFLFFFFFTIIHISKTLL